MSKKIGFRSYQNDEEPDKQDELSRTAESHSKLHRPELFTHRYHFTEMLQDHR